MTNLPPSFRAMNQHQPGVPSFRVIQKQARLNKESIDHSLESKLIYDVSRCNYSSPKVKKLVSKPLNLRKKINKTFKKIIAPAKSISNFELTTGKNISDICSMQMISFKVNQSSFIKTAGKRNVKFDNKHALRRHKSNFMAYERKKATSTKTIGIKLNRLDSDDESFCSKLASTTYSSPVENKPRMDDQYYSTSTDAYSNFDECIDIGDESLYGTHKSKVSCKSKNSILKLN
jgi:hypothetical protein